MWKINNLKLNNCQLKLFLQIESEAKAIKISLLSCLPVEKFNILLKWLLSYTHLIVYPKIYGQWDSDHCYSKWTFFCHDCAYMASIMMSWHACCKLVKVLSKEFSWRGYYVSNIFMLKSQTWWWIFTSQHVWGL